MPRCHDPLAHALGEVIVVNGALLQHDRTAEQHEEAFSGLVLRAHGGELVVEREQQAALADVVELRLLEL